MPDEKAILTALRKFAHSVTSKMTALTLGEPEDQLRGPFDVLMDDIGRALSLKVICTGETRLPGRVGKPDYAVHAAGLLAGYVELKAPGVGANPDHFTGRNRDQWKRFQTIPNLIYSDGNEWALYRNGQAIREARLSGNVARDGRRAVSPDDVRGVLGVLTDFFSWQPIVPTTREGEIDLKGLAALLAPLCRMLRADVSDALNDAQSPLVQIAKDWRQLLFPDASDEQFADAYAQTVTFALLLARSEGSDLRPPEASALANAEAALAAEHSLLSRALQVLTDPNAQAEISASLNLLIRIIGEVPSVALSAPKNPWLYFYEDFLGTYDPNYRRNMGVYYTPVEVVHAQVRLIDDLLRNRLGKPLGFADRDVVTLDPAVGTGTYLLGVINHALAKVQAIQGAGAVAGQATRLAANIYGFELMVGPYAVSELRVTRALRSSGAKIPREGLGVYLTDTLESPYEPAKDSAYLLRPIAVQHQKALKLKRDDPVLVCLGNPPYDRHEAATEANKARTGGWVRWGKDERGEEAIFNDFLDPALAAGYGVHIKNLYNLYVYFWRWAIWKVFEWEKDKGDTTAHVTHRLASRPGIVSFISASSYLDGDAFCGMREHMRHLCDEIWILDLGGEARGTRRSQNIFAIQTPVAIAIAVRYRKANTSEPAKVHFAQIGGTREEKLAVLDAVQSLASLHWEECPDGWQAPFRPMASGKYLLWPLLTDLLPWQHSGAQFKRTWPICPASEPLKARWRALLAASDKACAFKETRDRKVSRSYPSLPPHAARQKSIAQLGRIAPVPEILRYAYRSFDRQWILADNRLGDFLRPDLWAAHSEQQIYLSSLLTKPLGTGPAATACAVIPDLDHFSGRGAKDIVPLYRDAEAKEANITPRLLDILNESYGMRVSPEDFFAYLYGILAQPAFTKHYADELGTRQLRVPITRDAQLFTQVRDVGAKLLWLHTYGERYVPTGYHQGQVPEGVARCTSPVSGDAGDYPEKYEYNEATEILHIGNGEFSPVARQVYEFEVSGLKVVQSWLKYRMKSGGAKKSSSLDDIRPVRWTGDFTTELLELLWVLESTVAEHPLQAKLLTAVVKGACFHADELPSAPDWARKPPSRCAGEELFDNGKDEEN